MKDLLVRSSEVILAIALVLLFFLGFMQILSLSFPKGTGLGDLFGSAGSAGGPGFGAGPDWGSGAATDSSSGPRVIAHLTRSIHRVKDKAASSISWSDSVAGSALQDRHGVQTLSKSSATISFEDGGELFLNPKTLVIVRDLGDPRNSRRKRSGVILLDGELRGATAAGDKPLAVDVVTESGELRMQAAHGQPAGFKVTASPGSATAFTVYAGTGSVIANGKTVTIGPNQSLIVDSQQALGVPIDLRPPPKPLRPANNTQISFRSAPPRIGFTWAHDDDATGYLLEIARDFEFLDVVFTTHTKTPEFVHGNLAHGRNYWRVSSTHGRVESMPTHPQVLDLIMDFDPPDLQVQFPSAPVSAGALLLGGSTEPGAQVHIGEKSAVAADDGSFEVEVSVRPGANMLVVESIDPAGNISYSSQLVNAKHGSTERLQ